MGFPFTYASYRGIYGDVILLVDVLNGGAERLAAWREPSPHNEFDWITPMKRYAVT